MASSSSSANIFSREIRNSCSQEVRNAAGQEGTKRGREEREEKKRGKEEEKANSNINKNKPDNNNNTTTFAVKLNQTGLNMKQVSCKLKGSKARARPMQDEIQVPKRRRYHLTENHDEVFLILRSFLPGIDILRLLF